MGRLDNARKLFRHGVETNEENYHIPQAWAVSEAEHPEGDAATAREMFQRASSLAYWSVQTWAAWARFELDAEDNEQRLETARTLYERMGFEWVSVRKAYYPLNARTREDAIVMRLGLPT